MGEYIKRKAAYIRIMNNKRWAHSPSDMEYAADLVLTVPAADVVEVRHGEWKQVDAIFFDHEVLYFKCPLCNTTWESKTNYCPNCGAKMDGDKK